MKQFYITLFLCLFLNIIVNAAPKYWVGPLNGDWSNTANWANIANGTGGAAVPGSQDSVIFSYDSSPLIHVDQSPTISYLSIKGTVTLYASTPVTFTILKNLKVFEYQSLKDSTSADVRFEMVFNTATAATGDIFGDWIFEGGAPLNNRLSSGAAFTANTGALVTVSSVSQAGSSTPYDNFKGGQIIFKKNTGTITSNMQSLSFTYNTNFVFDNDLDAALPLATWSRDLTVFSTSNLPTSPAATFWIKTDIKKLQLPGGALELARVVLDLPNLSSDFDLALPDGTQIYGNLEIYNTNGHTLTLLASTSPTSTVNVGIGNPISVFNSAGLLVVNGNNTKVALARATADNPGISYRLTVLRSFSQNGGNFSLQEYNGATGATTLEVRDNINQTGGTFFTNSTSTAARFTISMISPLYFTGPSGSFNSARTISMSSGTIDNGSHKITLRIDHSVYSIPQYVNNPNGVILNTPLEVGRLELVRGPLTTSATNMLTVTDPSLDAITVGGPSTSALQGPASAAPTTASYVNGPITRATNSTSPYFFPTGKGYFYNNASQFTYNNSFINDSCYVIPTTSAPSMYQAEYFKTGYTDFSTTAPLLGVSQSEYWNFVKVSGADAQVKLKLRTPVVAVAGSQTLIAAHYENGHWVAAQGSIVNPCAITDSFVVSKPLSNLGAFTLGYLTDSNTPTVPANLSPGLVYKFYQADSFTLLPDFNALTPIATGVSSNVDPSVRPADVNYNYAFKWEGFITIATPGLYTFETGSDDGSKIYFNIPYCLNAAALVNNDGVHSGAFASGTINIAVAGTYPITITYFQNYSGQTMQLYWTGPNFLRQVIPDSVFSTSSGSTPPPSPGAGLNYKYYEGSFNVLPDFSTLTPVKTGKTPNVDISVRTAGVNDNFAFLWEGTITIPTAGVYTFETVSDDGSNLYFNGKKLVSNDGLHAPNAATGTVVIAAGVYSISITYFEKDGGESMQVYWAGPGISRQLIPDAAFRSDAVAPIPPQFGLDYSYYEGDFNVLPDFNTLTPIKTGKSANVDINIRPGNVDDHFAIVWDGIIIMPSAGTYTFETISDDGSKVVFNGNVLINNDGLHAPTSVTGTVTVPDPGVYPITISYFEKDGGQTMQLYWSGPGFTRQPVPDAAFNTSTLLPSGNTSGLIYKYYEGDWNMLPDFSTLTPVRSGISPIVDISIRPSNVNDHFAFTWNGYISIPTAGTYTFETVSDDGSKVYFNTPYNYGLPGTVSNDGLHAALSATGTVTVSTPGRYPISIVYFEKDGGETMQLYWTGPGIKRQIVPDYAFNISSDVGIIAANLSTQAAKANATLTGTAATKVYPNPFVESFTIDYYNEGSIKNSISIGLYDLNGKLIYIYQPANLVVGYNRWTVNIGSRNLAAGIYIAQVKVNGIPSKTIKLVKTKK